MRNLIHRTRDPEVDIGILTTYKEDDLMVRGLRAGPRICLLNDTGRETQFHTIRPDRPLGERFN
ncbi:MAG: hypothetical protein R3293_23195 [Candidatus Promineifilaceae bacterium]|nr:hypothetical protein [Candidatus Promineifilaceae bacterium]